MSIFHKKHEANDNFHVGSVVAIGLTLGQIIQYVAEARRRKKRLTIILAADGLSSLIDSLYKNNSIQRSDVSFCRYEDFISEVDEDEYFVKMPLYIVKNINEYLSYVQTSVPLFYKKLPLINIIQHHFQDAVWPLFQLMYKAEQVLKKEQPDEVWVCAKADWKFTNREHPWIPLGGLLDYRGIEIDSLILAAKLYGITVQFLKPSISNRVSYVFTRYLRPFIFKKYRQLQLAKLKLACRQSRDEYQNHKTHPLALALVRSPVHSRHLLPLIQELSKSSWETMIVKDYSLAVRQAGILSSHSPATVLAKWQGIRLYRHKALSKQLRQWLQHNWESLPAISYRGVVINEIFCQQLHQLADRYAEAISLLDAFDKVLDTYNPSVTIVANDQDLPARCLVGLCSLRGIPTVTVQHGLMAMPPLDFVPVASDRIAVMGNMAADLLSMFDTLPEKIHVTGIPGFDLAKPAIEQNHFSDLNGSITLITQKWPPFFRFIFPRFLQLASEMPDEHFVIKVAPQEPASKYSNPCSNIKIIHGESIEKVLRNSKIVIGFNSTALLEAMHMGIPTLVINLFFEHINPMTPAATCIKLDSDWGSVVHEILHNKIVHQKVIERQNKHLRNLLRQDGGAATRIASIVMSLAKAV